MTLWTALRKEMIEQWRTYRVLVVGAVLVLFGLTSPLLARYLPEFLAMMPGGEMFTGLIPPPSTPDAVGQYLNNLGQFGVLLAVLLAMGTVAVEKDRGTAAMMLVKPLGRGAFLGAKLLALGITFATAIAVAAMGAYYYTWILFEPLSVAGWLALNALLFIYLMVYVGITMLGSTLTRSQMAAAGIAVGTMILLSIVGIVPAVGRMMPSRLLTWGAQLALGIGGGSAWGALLVSLGIVAATFGASWWSFRTQEL